MIRSSHPELEENIRQRVAHGPAARGLRCSCCGGRLVLGSPRRPWWNPVHPAHAEYARRTGKTMFNMEDFAIVDRLKKEWDAAHARLVLCY